MPHPGGGYHHLVWDSRVIMSMVYRYGQAVESRDLAQVGLLYSAIVRALEDQDDEIGPDSVPKDEAGAVPV